MIKHQFTCPECQAHDFNIDMGITLYVDKDNIIRSGGIPNGASIEDYTDLGFLNYHTVCAGCGTEYWDSDVFKEENNQDEDDV